ncbi:MAG: spheroidene monooxygenase [Pseudomonadota bacterium]
MTTGDDQTTTTLSLFRFGDRANKLWAFHQMPTAPRRLARAPGLRFFKLLGSGSGQGFSPWPNWGVYGFLGAWESPSAAQAGVSPSASALDAFRARATEHCTLTLRATRCRGAWSGVHPFPINAEDAPDEPVAVLTRASIRPMKAFAFWRRETAISADIGVQDAVRLKIGLGEAPLLRQATFSIWTDRAAIDQFARRNAAHGEAARDAWRLNWFSEYLFARFRILDVAGRWNGGDPLTA